MARSSRFGSISNNYRPIQTRFRYDYTYRLNLAIKNKSLAHYAKGTQSGISE